MITYLFVAAVCENTTIAGIRSLLELNSAVARAVELSPPQGFSFWGRSGKLFRGAQFVRYRVCAHSLLDPLRDDDG